MIYLLRHGSAEPREGGEDADRSLTATGREEARAAGRALATLGVKLDACLASPKRRAAETAALACEPLRIEPETQRELETGPFDPLALVAGRGEALLVGHEPSLSTEIAGLSGGRVKLGKGGLAILDGTTLVALLRPEDLAAIAADSAPAARGRLNDRGARP